MIKRLLMLLIVALIGWVVYVTFFGTDEDIKLRNNLLGSAKDLGENVVSIFKSESEKVQEGTYDEAIDKLTAALNKLKEADEKKNEHGDDLKKLMEEKERIEKLIAENKNNEVKSRSTEDPNAQNEQDLKKLAEDISELAKKMEKEK